jgi:protein-S-isoprenylcysteine O-methyltransferase Ste14
MEDSMAESPERDRASVIAPPPLLTVICGAAGFLAGHFRPLPFLGGSSVLRIVLCSAILLLAVTMSFSGLRQLITSREHPSPYEPTKAIVAGGIYRFTRNPIYVGFLLLLLAAAIGANNGWLLLAFLALFFLLQFGVVKPEERYLSRKFGQSYDDYCRRVRRWV